MEAYKVGSKIKVSAINMKEFKELIEKAEKEACQLQETINKLKCFDIDFKFDFGGAKV